MLRFQESDLLGLKSLTIQVYVHDNEVPPRYDDYHFTSSNQNDSINRLPDFNTDVDNTNDSFSVSRISGTKQQEYTSKSSYPVNFNTDRRSLSGSSKALLSRNFCRRRDVDTFYFVVNGNTVKISNSRMRKFSTTKTKTKSNAVYILTTCMSKFPSRVILNLPYELSRCHFPG